MGWKVTSLWYRTTIIQRNEIRYKSYKNKGTSRGVPFLMFAIFNNMTNREKKQKNREKMAKATRKMNQKKGLDRKKS